MARQKLEITYADGRKVVGKVSPKVEVAVEKHFNIGLGQLQNDMHAEYLYYMGWAALHYSGQEALEFEKFMNVLEDVELVQDKEDEDDPFTKAPPSEISSL